MTLVSAMRLGGFLGAAAGFLAGCGGGTDAPVATGTLPPTQVATVAVTPPPGTSGNLVAGQSLQLSAAPRDAGGNAVNATVTWSSSATSVATVSLFGLVTAVGPGSATITAQATTSTATATSTFVVTVAAIPTLTSVGITGTLAVVAGQTTQLTATPRDQNGAAIEATISWSSAATGIATVSASGLVTGVAAGVATITATATSGDVRLSGTASVTVQGAPVQLSSVTISPNTSTLVVGATLQLTATPRDQEGNPVAAALTWGTSAPGVASVTQAGLVTAMTVGSVVITAQATLSGQTASAQRSISVVAAPPVLTSVSVSAVSNAVVVGGATLQLTSEPRDQNGAPMSATVAWSSSNPSRATVSGTGLVVGISAGAVTITATATAGGASVSGRFALTSLILTSVQVSGAATVSVGSTTQYTAALRDQIGGLLSAPVAWSSSDNSRATVSALGVVTGVAAGTSNITATATLGSATVASFRTITVSSPFPTSANVTTVGVSFSPASVDIAAGGQVNWSGLLGHNVTFGTPGSPANITGAASGSRTFPAAGTFAYSCTIHAGMNGAVVVH